MAKKKTIMRAFKIDEISAVDSPAQKGAKAVIMKRNNIIVDEDLPQDGEYLYKNQLRISSAVGGKAEKSLVDVAVTELDTLFRGDDVTSEDRIGIVSKMSKAWLETNPDKTESDLPVILKSQTNPKENDMTPEEIKALQKSVTDLTAANTAQTAELAKAKKLSEMTDAEKAKYNSMNDTQKADFLTKSAEERAAIIKNDADSNPVVFKNAAGDEFRKNDDPRLVAMAKKADEDSKIAKTATDKFEKAELEKRAVEVFKNSPGTAEEKGAMLKALEAIPDENLRKKAIESAKAGDNALAAAFTRKGAGGGTNSTDTSATDELDKLAKARSTEMKISYAKAYSEVLATPEGSELYTKSLQK